MILPVLASAVSASVITLEAVNEVVAPEASWETAIVCGPATALGAAEAFTLPASELVTVNARPWPRVDSWPAAVPSAWSFALRVCTRPESDCSFFCLAIARSTGLCSRLASASMSDWVSMPEASPVKEIPAAFPPERMLSTIVVKSRLGAARGRCSEDGSLISWIIGPGPEPLDRRPHDSEGITGAAD